MATQTGIQLVSANPTKVPAGTMIFNTATQQFRGFAGQNSGGTSLPIPLGGASGGNASVAAATAITNLLSFSVSSAFANQTTRTFRFKVVFQADASHLADTYTFYVRWNTTTLFSIAIPALTLGQSVIAILDVDLCVTVTGSSGSVTAAIKGDYSISSATPVAILSYTTTTVNLTTNPVNVFFSASAASADATNQMGVPYLAFEIIN